MRAFVIAAALLGCQAIFASIVFGAEDTSADSPKELALSLAKKAGRARKKGQFAQAYLLYSEAAALVPGNRKYKAQMELLETRAANQSKPVPPTGSASVPEPVLPEDAFDSITAAELAKARDLNSIPSLRAKPGKQNFDLSGDARTLFDKVAQSFGLETVYDGDYPKNGARIVFRITDADYREALNDLDAATGSFVIPLSSRLLMIAADTPAKRTDLEQTMEIAVSVPQVLTTQELTEMAQVVRQTTNVEKISWDTVRSQIVIKDRVSRVMPAVALLEQLISYRPQVMIELQFIQVNSSDVVNYGFTAPNNIPAVYLGGILRDVAVIPSGVTSLATFGGGKTLIGLAVAQAGAMFNQTLSTSNTLYQTQLRSVAGQPATLHVGEKYPVITQAYAGGVSTTSPGVYAPPPSYTFENLGLQMKITPFVHGMGEVTLTVETSVEVLAGQSVNSIPVIGRQSLNSQVRLRNDEWAVVAGLMNPSKSKGTTGFWGLAEIPFLGNLFRQVSTDDEDNDVLIAIKPHLMSLPPDQIVTRPLRVGSDNRPYTPL
ncbi:MAG: type II and III secretion system protein [Bryobacteraceae bacterium]|jgi:Flp pilus assembly secretin CpaC